MATELIIPLIAGAFVGTVIGTIAGAWLAHNVPPDVDIWLRQVVAWIAAVGR